MTREYDKDGKIMCNFCKRTIRPDEYVTDFPGPNYGFGPMVCCDPCLKAAPEGSWLAERRDG